MNKVVLAVITLLTLVHADSAKHYQGVLDGYSKDFHAVIHNIDIENHLALWLCLQPGDIRSLYSVLGIPRDSKYFLPIVWGGNGLAIDYQDFIEDVSIASDDDNRQTILLSAKREASKGTTVKVTFIETGEEALQEQNYFIDLIERLVLEQFVVAPDSVIERAMPIEDKQLVHYCDQHVRSRLPHKHASPEQDL